MGAKIHTKMELVQIYNNFDVQRDTRTYMAEFKPIAMGKGRVIIEFDNQQVADEFTRKKIALVTVETEPEPVKAPLTKAELTKEPLKHV